MRAAARVGRRIMRQPMAVSESANLLPLLIQVLAAFSKSSKGELLEAEIDSALGFLRYDYPEAVYSELRKMFRQALNEQVDLAAMAHRLAPQGLTWLEEPVWPPENVAGLADVRRRGGIPTAAGENYGTVWDFRRAFEAGALDYAQPSVTKIGGVTELRKVQALAETFGVTVVPHSAYFGPGLLASIHCIASSRVRSRDSAAIWIRPREPWRPKSISLIRAARSSPACSATPRWFWTGGWTR